MSDLVIADPTLVLATNEATTVYDCGVAITAGQSIYPDASNLWQLADATAQRSNYAIALANAAANQPLLAIVGGTLDLGVTLQQGQAYVISATGGGIAPISDLIATNFINIIGYANDNNELIIKRWSVPFALV